MREDYDFVVNGLEIRARFPARDAEAIFLPLLLRLTRLQRALGRRIAVFLAGPPGAGKSTLCRYLEALSREMSGLEPVQSVGLDGFHYPQAYLERHFTERDGARVPLSAVKGAPESYDAGALRAKLSKLGLPGQRWPLYSRVIHDPVPDAVEIASPIVIVEGNWLLLNEPPWRALACDYSVFLRADGPGQLERVVRRKMQGGFGEAEARAFALYNDWPNLQRCMARSRRADLNLAPRTGGGWEEV